MTISYEPLKLWHWRSQIEQPVLVEDGLLCRILVCFEARVLKVTNDLQDKDSGLSHPSAFGCCLKKQARMHQEGVSNEVSRVGTQHVWPWPCFLSLPTVIPKVTKHLLSNPVFTCIVLAACMEIAVVAGFAAFLGKYLEQQFNLTTSSANQLLGEWVPLLSGHTQMFRECTESQEVCRAMLSQ